MMGRLRLLLRSYRARLALGYALVVVLIAGTWAWSLYQPFTDAVLQQQRAQLRSLAQAGALTLARPEGTPESIVHSLVRGSDMRATVIAADGTVLADTSADPATMGNHADRPEVRAALDGRVGYATRRSSTLGTDQTYVAIRGTLNGGYVVFRISEPVAHIDAVAGQARNSGLLLLGAALAISALVGLRLSQSAAEPVLRLKEAARFMASGELNVVVPEVEGELADLAAALRLLQDEIRGRIDSLGQEQAALRRVLDGLQDAVFVFEADRVVLANEGAVRLFGVPSGGWPGVLLTAAGLPVSLASEVLSALRADRPLVAEVGPDPTHSFYRVTAVPLETGGSQVLVTIADVTERRQLDQVRRDFVANASHELKTPTAAIQLLADAVTTAADDGDTEQALRFAASMKAEADRLRGLVLDLLDLSRLESIPAPGTITNVRAAIDNATTAHRRAAAAAGLSIVVNEEAVADEDVYAAVDPTDVAIALDNLLANAVTYTESGSVTLALKADDATVTITVRDTGIGIPAEHLSRVFERFYRVDAARSRESGGTGLGLALVKHVAERAGGSVDIQSLAGEGTTVTLRLPRSV